MARLNPTNFGYQNFYSALLTADITSGSLTISVDTVPTPTSGILVIDPDSTTNREVILYTSKGASTITLPSDGRGFDGSTAVSHLTGTTVIMAPVKRMYDALASGETSTDPLRTESFFDYIASGVVWTGDSIGSTRVASATTGVAYILGRRLTVPVVSSRTFTASKDTYVDITDNLDGTAAITYNEVSNNAASPALATNALRVGIIVTGATTIATTGSINQGQPTAVLPIASSTAYTTTDSLGNLIYPTDPNRRVLGYRQVTASQGSITALVDLTGLSAPVIVPAGRKIKVSGATVFSVNSASGVAVLAAYESSTELGIVSVPNFNITNGIGALLNTGLQSPTTGSHTYKLRAQATANTVTANSAATEPSWILIELE